MKQDNPADGSQVIPEKAREREETFEDVKKLVAGQFGEQLERFPLRFCRPVYFGPPPSKEHRIAVNSATVSLLNVGGNRLAVTCHHVIDRYRQKLADARCLFAIGNCYFDPLAQLVAEDQVTDIAVLGLTERQAVEVIRGSNGIGDAFYEIGSWPPTPVAVNDYVAYGGFPGDLRQHISFRELSFGTYSSGSCRVTDLHADYLTCEFEREHWIRHGNELEPESLGGLSGGPVFAIRHSQAGVISYEFAGVIFRMHEQTESLYIRQASVIPIGPADTRDDNG